MFLSAIKSSNYLSDYKYSHKNSYEILKDHINKNKFNNDTNLSMLNNNLINIYENYDSFQVNNNKPSGISENSIILNNIYNEKLTTRKKQGHCIVNKENFLDRFNKLTDNLLNFFDWNNIVVAGGVVNLALSHEPIEELKEINYDIDIFIYGLTEGQAKKTINNVYESFKDIVPDNKCIKTNKTITVINKMPFRHIQFITNIYESKGDILHSFDLSSSKVLFIIS